MGLNKAAAISEDRLVTEFFYRALENSDTQVDPRAWAEVRQLVHQCIEQRPVTCESLTHGIQFLQILLQQARRELGEGGADPIIDEPDQPDGVEDAQDEYFAMEG